MLLPNTADVAFAETYESSHARGWGVSAFTFGPPGAGNAVELRRFLRAGSFPEVTPTQAKLWWDGNLLHAEFLNTELDPLYHGNPGLAKPIHYPGNERFEISAYPDAVYVQFRPDWKSGETFLFAADSSGACNQSGLEVDIARQPGEWRAHLRIPWALAGGRPEGVEFGINLARSRGQSSEVLSPVVLDQTLILPPDLLMSASFGKQTAVWSAAGFLIALPDGTRRWQLPAQLIWPTTQERQKLWQDQKDLKQPTTQETLSERVWLAQRLYDMLVLEGFSFHTDGSNWQVDPGEFYPHEARIAVNQAFCDGDTRRACAVLDTYLHQLDRVTRRWFADASPGNICAKEWVPVMAMGEPQREGNEIRLNGTAGRHPFSVWLSFCNGAVRLRNQYSGFFQPEQADPFTMTGRDIVSGDIHVRIENNPWRIVVLDSKGKTRWSLGEGDLAVRLDAAGEILAVDLHGRLSPEENFYGFGERFNALGQRGNVVTLWDVDCWSGNIHGQLNQAYKNVPLMHSTAGYSLFWSTTYRVRADIGNVSRNQYRLTAFGNIFDIYLWPTAPGYALQSYLRLTGMPILPPQWAFEPWMGGGGRRWANGPLHNVVQEEIGVVKRFQQLDIPHSAIYAEAGNGDPALYAALKDTNLHVFAWDWASMDIHRVIELLPGVHGTQLPVLRHANGEVVFRSEQNAIVDYTHPLATELIRRFWQPRLDLGLAGSMVDFGDMVPEDAVFHNGKGGTEMHNFYAYFYHQTFAQVFQEKRKNDYVQFARSGCAGDQRSICYFAGDHQANFFGMRAALRGGLNAAACGLSTWGADAGGYAGWPDPEVYIRWTQWATFCPLMRYHGTTPREPWEYGNDAVSIYRRYAWLRENLLPYIVRCAQEAHEHGIPLMRPMPLAFPGSSTLANCDDQYLFGPDLLIAPVLAPGESRGVVLPPGTWTDFWTAASYEGGKSIQIATPIDRIGVFLRAGACIPLELAGSHVPGDSMSAGRVKAILATKSDAQDQIHVAANGATALLIYGNGSKQVIPIGPHQEAIQLP